MTEERTAALPVGLPRSELPGDGRLPLRDYREGYEDGYDDATIVFGAAPAKDAGLALVSPILHLERIGAEGDRALLRHYARITSSRALLRIKSDASLALPAMTPAPQDASESLAQAPVGAHPRAPDADAAMLGCDVPSSPRLGGDDGGDAVSHSGDRRAIGLVALLPLAAAALAGAVFWLLLPHWMPVASLVAFMLGGVVLDLFGDRMRRRWLA